MKNTYKLLIVLLISVSFAACGAKKGGCGLTSDAATIQQNTTITQTALKAEV